MRTRKVREGKVEKMIIAPAIKTKEGKIFASRNSHAEIIILHPKDFKNAEQGFITDKLDFVDRKEALKIAKECKQDINKLVDNDELYSEDLFLSGGINKMDIPKQEIKDKIEEMDSCIELQKIIKEEENNDNPKKYYFAREVLQELLE